jgi:PIN domain nuclease of toxin-antitoxin system
VRLLLDTHLLLWALGDARKLGKAATALIHRSEVHASAASIWEISIKASLGKLQADPRSVLSSVEPAGFGLLAVSGEHAARVFELGRLHQDPFDLLLIAQAQVEGMTLLTNDAALAGYGAAVQVI